MENDKSNNINKEENENNTNEEIQNEQSLENNETVEEVVIEENEAENEQKKYAELMDKYMRSLADFDNFRKRTSKEKASMYNNGVCDTVAKILPLLDNFERALSTVSNKEDNFYKGLEMILKQFTTVLDELGVEAIEAVDATFDHNVHFAVAHVDDSNYGTNIVIEELQRGYKIKDKVIRPSMVKVAN